MYTDLIDEAKRSEVLSKELITQLMEVTNYNSFTLINWSIDVLKIIKTRVDRGDKITDEVSKVIYSAPELKNFVKKHFSSYIYSQVYTDSLKSEKIYFQLERCEDGYNLVMAPSANEKTYRWISSLSKRFSLVEMIATGIVYIKDNKTNTYSPFISENGKYCQYNTELGKIIEK